MYTIGPMSRVKLTTVVSGFFLLPLRGTADGEGSGKTESVVTLMMSNWSAGVNLGFSLLVERRVKEDSKETYWTWSQSITHHTQIITEWAVVDTIE